MQASRLQTHGLKLGQAPIRLTPGGFAAFGRDDPHRAEFLTNEAMIALAGKLRIGQHTLNARELADILEQRWEQRPIVAGTMARYLGQN